METVAIVAAILIGMVALRYLKRKPIVEGTVENANFREVESAADLADIFDPTDDRKQLLYLHDPW